MIIISINVNVPIPPLAFLFLLLLLEFAKMDIFQGTPIFKSLFDFKETSPLNDNFELYGHNTLNFILISSSYFLIQMVILLYCIFKVLLNKLAAQFPRFKLARMVGMWAY
jgi:hypothetical protein